MEEEDSVIRASYLFRGIDYVVTMKVSDETSLDLEVEDPLGGDLWRGTFDAAYIEDLTHKTGNFKQFSIFVSMLESALDQATDSVSLDLLTYSDLESLRQRKSGVGTKPSTVGKANALNTKRYLILTYTVEFDRIHYPLPLPYVGQPNPKQMQDTVKQLRAEIKMLREKGDSEYLQAELDKLQKSYDMLTEEKESLESEYMDFRRDVRGSTSGSAAKEIRILKNMIKNLEADLMKEKTRHQRSASKRSQEYRQLLEEAEELRSSERNLKVRVKSLTNELAMYKRRQSRSPGVFSSQRSSQHERRRSASTDRARSSFSRERSSSRDRQVNRSRPPTREKTYERTSSRERRGSFEGPSGLRRNPSPAGTRNPRFDPTAYIKEKERRKQESELKNKKVLRPSNSAGKNTKPSPLYQRGLRTNRSRTSSIGSTGSYGYQSDGNISDSSQGRKRSLKRGLKPGRVNSSSAWDSPNVPLQKTKPLKQRSMLSSTPDTAADKARRRNYRDKENYPNDGEAVDDPFDRSAEIDERLNRLQAFMKANLP